MSLNAARFLAVTTATVGILVMGGGVATAGPGEPLGPPMIVTVSPEGQKAIANGSTAAAGAITCALSSGTACAVTGVLMAAITPIVEGATVCPNDGLREIVVELIESPDPHTPVFGGAIVNVVSSRCIPG
jgi:hypothetical protein